MEVKGEKPTQDDIIKTLLKLYADQNHVEIKDLVITVPQQQKEVV